MHLYKQFEPGLKFRTLVVHSIGSTVENGGRASLGQSPNKLK